MSKIIELGKTYSLDLSGSSPVDVETISFTEKGVMCKYLSSWAGRVEELDYELFKMNGYFKPLKNDTQLIFSGAPYAPTTITFYLNGQEEVIKLSKEGFYYKGKLIAEDKEIYLRFKEWMDQAHSQIPKLEPQKFNSIEERDNLIGLLQEVLKFYGDANNYKGNRSASSCCSGTVTSLVEIDEGSQARSVLERAKQLAKENQKIQDEYDKFIMNSDAVDFSNGETNPIDLIKVFQQTHDENNDIR